MTVWLAIAGTSIVATLCFSGCVAYVLISLCRTAQLLGTRLGHAELQVIRVSHTRRPSHRARRAQLGLRPMAFLA